LLRQGRRRRTSCRCGGGEEVGIITHVVRFVVNRIRKHHQNPIGRDIRHLAPDQPHRQTLCGMIEPNQNAMFSVIEQHCAASGDRSGELAQGVVGVAATVDARSGAEPLYTGAMANGSSRLPSCDHAATCVVAHVQGHEAAPGSRSSGTFSRYLGKHGTS
jgi:hypothetical protein